MACKGLSNPRGRALFGGHACSPHPSPQGAKHSLDSHVVPFQVADHVLGKTGTRVESRSSGTQAAAFLFPVPWFSFQVWFAPLTREG